MSLSNGLVEDLDHVSRGAGHESSPYAPKSRRDGQVRKVVPLHLPSAPQLVPVDSGAPVAAAKGRRPTGPELLAEDVVLKRLLQRHSPDPQPLAVPPTRDPVGFALGMVARLMVAGCAAAGVILIVLGVIPLPHKLLSAATDETVVATTMPTVGAGAAEQSPNAAATSGEGAAQAATLAEPTQTATVRQAPAAKSDQWSVEVGEIERLVKRGEEYLARGDIAAARLILGRAAEAHDARAAFSLATTYDPIMLKQLRVVGFKADIAQARAWYERAVGYGSQEAARRLATIVPGAQ
jgi:hypothetical protein